MASVKDRLARQEARRAPPYQIPVYLTLYLKELENIRRQEDGLEPLSLTPEEEAERERGDKWFLEEGIPELRAQGGSPETMAMIDQLEEHARREINR